MNNWALDNTFDKFSSSFVKSFDSMNNIALDISGYVILRNDMILYDGLTLNNKLAQLQSQYHRFRPTLDLRLSVPCSKRLKRFNTGH